MFGYIRPFKPELKIREFEEYKSYYCTLCKTLQKRHGFFAKFFLNYDFTFLALLLASLQEEQACYKKARCTFNPLKKCGFCQNNESSFEFAADLSMIFLHYKLNDNILDDRFIKRLLARMTGILIRKGYKKACEKLPHIDRVAQEVMKKQSALEKMEQLTVDMAAQPSATLLAEVFAFAAADDAQKRILYEFGYHLGKWVYLIDALDDYKKDVKANNFNAYYKSDECGRDYEEVKAFAEVRIEQCITGYENAFLLLDFKHNKGILENILFGGNPSMFCKITMKERKCHE